jgi:hypothetical protein
MVGFLLFSFLSFFFPRVDTNLISIALPPSSEHMFVQTILEHPHFDLHTDSSGHSSFVLQGCY